MKKKMVTVLVILVCIALAYYAAYQQEPLRKYLPTLPSITNKKPPVPAAAVSEIQSLSEYRSIDEINEKDIDIEELPMNSDLITIEDKDIVIQDDAILPMSETLATPGFSFKVNSAKASKKPIIFSPSNYMYFDSKEKVDKAGAITNAYTYVNVNVTMKCLRKKPVDYAIATPGIGMIENGKEVDFPELRVYRCIEDTKKISLKGHVFFEPQESLTFDLGYIVPDEYLSKGTCVFDCQYQGSSISYLLRYGIKKQFIRLTPEKIE